MPVQIPPEWFDINNSSETVVDSLSYIDDPSECEYDFNEGGYVHRDDCRRCLGQEERRVCRDEE